MLLRLFSLLGKLCNLSCPILSLRLRCQSGEKKVWRSSYDEKIREEARRSAQAKEEESRRLERAAEEKFRQESHARDQRARAAARAEGCEVSA